MEWSEDADGTLAVEVLRRDSYPIAIGRGKIETVPSFVARTLQTDSLFIITDENVAELLLKRAIDLFSESGLRVESVIVPAGERSKSWPAAQKVIGDLSNRAAMRRSALLALGGGVIVDMVGFVAAVFMRGLPYINVPTSLLAQLDAAIGGKTGIDYDGSKNLLGAFYHPSAVVIDPDLLATLPDREIRSGLAEAVKVGMLHEPLFARLENLTPRALDDMDALSAITRDAIMCKMNLLKDDPFEQSLLRLLNLGHSVGHALEAVTGFEIYRHGEAVAIGLAVAAVISWGRNLCSTATRDRIVNCLESCGLAISMPQSLTQPIWREINVIRRIRNGVLNEVLPVRIGDCIIVNEISYHEFAAAVETLASLSTISPAPAAD